MRKISIIGIFLLCAGIVIMPQTGWAKGKIKTPAGREAEYYAARPDGAVQCQLCPRACVLQDQQTGYCRVRKNLRGKLTALTYARPCSLNVDPIEKKPLYHFLPGSPVLSLATVGCNLRCIFCQNWNISQAEPAAVETRLLSPEQAVQTALDRSCPAIAFTYSEPTVYYEYMRDIAALADQNHIRCVMITCGYIKPKPLAELCRVIQGTHVDLKGFSDKTYGQVANAELAPFLDTLKTFHASGVWLEIGYLVIPTLNDSPQEIKSMADWVVANLGPDVPIHFLRFFPQHKLTKLPPTPLATLEQAARLARQAGTHYVYIGNVPGHPLNNTYCHHCGKLLIVRRGFFLGEMNLDNGHCEFCGTKIPGVWN